MRKAIFLFVETVLSCLLFFTSCEKDTDNNVDSQINMLEGNNYFPMHVGDYWQMDFLSKRAIDAKVELDGKNYFRMLCGQDTVYYRISEERKVYSRKKSTDEVLSFDLNASVGDTWSIKDFYSDLTWNVTLTSKSDIIELDNYTFSNCYRFYIDIPQLADDERIVWLAPGIGIVEESYLGGTADRKKLKKVKINDIEIQF